MIPKEQAGSGIIRLDGAALYDASTAVAQYDLNGDNTDSGPSGLDLNDIGAPTYGVIGSGYGMTESLDLMTPATRRKGWNNPSGSIRLQGDTTATYAALRILGALTLQCWGNPSSAAGFKLICSQGNSGTPDKNALYHWQMSAGELRFISTDDTITTTVITSGAGIVANRWQHFAVTRSADGLTLTFYAGLRVDHTELGNDVILQSWARGRFGI